MNTTHTGGRWWQPRQGCGTVARHLSYSVLSTSRALTVKPRRVVEGALSSPPPGLCVLLLTLCLSEYCPFCTAHARVCCSPCKGKLPPRYLSASEKSAMVQTGRKWWKSCRNVGPKGSFTSFLPLLPFRSPPSLLLALSSHEWASRRECLWLFKLPAWGMLFLVAFSVGLKPQGWDWAGKLHP